MNEWMSIKDVSFVWNGSYCITRFLLILNFSKMNSVVEKIMDMENLQLTQKNKCRLYLEDKRVKHL